MTPSEPEILRELERLSQAGLLSPQERVLLRHIVRATLDGHTSELYQKALAKALKIENVTQIGVIGSRVRAKLAEHYRDSQASTVQIELSKRGYEALFAYRSRVSTLGDRVGILIANAKSAIDQRTLPGAKDAFDYLERASAVDPRHPLLLPLKAYCHATRALYGSYPREDLERAAAIVEQTRVTADRPWESWFAEACVDMALHWNWPGAAAAFERALALSEGEAQYQPWYTAFLACQGQGAKAVSLLRVSVSRAHDSPIVRADLAANQVFAGQYDDAEETIQTACALFGPRTHYLLYVHLSMLREARGDGQGALDALAQVPLKWPRTSITLGLRAMFSGLAGDRRTAHRHYTKLRAMRMIAGGFVPALQLCVAAFGAGDIPTAMQWLREGAVVERDPNMILCNVYPFFRHLHQEPGFRDTVVTTMKLALPR